MYEEYIKELLRKNLEVSEQSLAILKKMDRARKIGAALKIAKWIVIAILALGIYYYIEPYINSFLDNITSFVSTAEEIKKTGDAINSGNISPDILEKLKTLLPR